VGWRSLSPHRTDRGPLRLRGRASDRSNVARVGVSLSDQTGNPVPSGRLRPEAAARFSLRWPRNGHVSLRPGAYRIALRAVDELGNLGVSSQRTFLVDRPVRARVWGRFSGVGRRVALTFDDCNSPSAWTSILHTLRRYRIKATFFCPGQQVRASPLLARRTVAARHAIGSHGWDHANFASLSYGSARARLSYDREVWWHLARVSPTPYFRPPYGAYTASTMAAAGAEGYGAIVLWDVDPRDWTSPGTAAIIQRVVSHTHPGSIVLMHVLPQTAAGLPTIIRRLRAKRLKMLTLPELARLGSPSPGGWKSY
jgi:peptidoglycan/xylan/chitin deacetylase (PgdA/CDA1 family)